MQPSWQPDPTGRHDYRWWDGVEWTARVSTRGSVADDPLPQGTSFATPKPGPRRMGWVVPTALVAVLAVVSFWVYRAVRNPVGHGLGVHGIEFSDSRLDAVDLRLDAGRAARIRVEPADGIDVRIAVAVDDDTATAIAEVLIDRYPDELPTVLGRARDDRTPLTVDDVRAAFFVAVADVFGEDLAADERARPWVLVEADAAGAGGFEATWFLSDIDADYRILAGITPASTAVASGDRRARVLIEEFDEPYPGDRIYDPAWFEARTFFDDPAFFEADGAYAEVSADTESLTSEPVSTRSSDGATTEPG
ncbi:MAG: DUF2510 domain-containing protein [Ilumatobacteraceae bacterium]